MKRPDHYLAGPRYQHLKSMALAQPACGSDKVDEQHVPHVRNLLKLCSQLGTAISLYELHPIWMALTYAIGSYICIGRSKIQLLLTTFSIRFDDKVEPQILSRTVRTRVSRVRRLLANSIIL